MDWDRLKLSFFLAIAAAGCATILVLSSARADRLRYLDSAIDAGKARVDSSRAGQRETLGAYFIYSKDKVALRGLATMRLAARQGQRAFLLVDALFVKINRPMIKHLQDEGVIVRLYHPFQWRKPWRLFHRLHDKLWIVDGTIAITGGRNADDAFFGWALKNYADRDAIFDGEAAADAREYFMDLWRSDHAVMPNISHVTATAAKQAGFALDAVEAEMYDEGLISDSDAPKDWLEGEPDIGPIEFIASRFDANGKRQTRKVGERLGKIVIEAEEYVQIVTPYLVPSQRVMVVFQDLIRRGKKIKILTNSSEASDGVIPVGAYLKHRDDLIRMGIELWEFQGPESLHEKSAVVDGQVGIIGTYNLDLVSAIFNSEVTIAFRNAMKAKELLDRHAERFKKAICVGQGGQILRSKALPKGMKLRKKAAIKCSQALTPLYHLFSEGEDLVLDGRGFPRS